MSPGCRAIVTAERLKTSMYLQMLQTLAPELAHSEPGALKAAKLPALQWVIRMGAEATPGMLNYDALLQRGRASLQTAAARRDQRGPELPSMPSTSSSPAAPPATPRARR